MLVTQLLWCYDLLLVLGRFEVYGEVASNLVEEVFLQLGYDLFWDACFVVVVVIEELVEEEVDQVEADQ